MLSGQHLSAQIMGNHVIGNDVLKPTTLLLAIGTVGRIGRQIETSWFNLLKQATLLHINAFSK